MEYQFWAAAPFQVLGLLGLAVFVGVHALRIRRIIGGDGLIFFSGNTVAAALVLASNFGSTHVLWLLTQIVLIAIALTVMIAIFYDARTI